MTSTITAVLFGLMSGSAESALPRLELAPAARAVLAAFAASPTERLGCLLGSVDGATVRVKSVLATDDSGATATRVVARAPCPPAAVGRVHSHPGAERCWYWFPGTQVETSDAVSFRLGGYPVDAIVCGPTLVYVTRAGGAEAQSLAIVDRNVPVLLAEAAVDREPDGSIIERWAQLFSHHAIDSGRLRVARPLLGSPYLGSRHLSATPTGCRSGGDTPEATHTRRHVCLD